MKEIEEALDDLRPGLDSDGFDLKFDSMESNGNVRIALEARPGACLECLVPDELLVQMLEMNIRDRLPEVGRVLLEKRGF
jgi:Fe-S cluster biogenesis protein NfuA